MGIESRYFDGTYLSQNPEWDRADAEWKAAQVSAIVTANRLTPASICDVGCGSGDVLAKLQGRFPTARLTGFDVSPQLAPFWARHPTIRFERAPFHESASEVFDLLLMLDVFEHVRDPFTFLEQARGRARHFVFHIPLDLCALTVARGSPLMNVRRKVGHLHFYTKDLALETLQDCGYQVLDWRYTNAAQTLSTHRTPLTALASLPRRLLRALSPDVSARVLGGETLIVLAR